MIKQPEYERFVTDQFAAGIAERLGVLEGSPAARGLMLPSQQNEQRIRAAAEAALAVLRRDLD